MMRLYLALILFAIAHSDYAQQNHIDSLEQIIRQNKEDKAEANALIDLSYRTKNFDTAIAYARRGLLLSKKINFKKGEANSSLLLSGLFARISNTTQSIQHSLNALNIFQQLNDNVGIASSHLVLQANYRDAQDYTEALSHEFKGEKIARQYNVIGTFDFPGHRLAPLFLAETAQTYILMNNLDSAIIYARQSIRENELFEGTPWTFPYYILATIQSMKGDSAHSSANYHEALRLAKVQAENANDTIQIYSGISTLFKNTGQLDSSIYYARIVNTSWRPELSEKKNLLEAVNNLYEVYKLKREKDSCLKYLELNYHLHNNFLSAEKEKQIQEITFGFQLKQQQIMAEQIKYKSRLQAFVFIAGILLLLIISGLSVRNSRQNKKAKLNIKKAYDELRSTQAQLIQSEKMASLGEITAGIAHEIQNPLNFVNNFSEVNRELIDEANQEIDNGNIGEVKTIMNDIKENEEKINHHGKRADAIVKNMLQHSRSSSSKKEPTDINKLADEYLRLSYHGFRAKDKSFNATLQTEFDLSIGNINVVPQDIGRVLLNLYNNAFYAMTEKNKTQGESYEPTISVSTKKVNNKVQLTVTDNGNGIPQNIVDKIFQPFFTTKPTGQGTGLGLSLAYDIVTKEHGGTIRVESKEGVGTRFIVLLSPK